MQLLRTALRRVGGLRPPDARAEREALRRALAEAERIYAGTQQAAAAVVDLRRVADRAHLLRLMLYAERLARRLRVRGRRREALLQGAVLHDAGKTAIPRAVLQKSSGLTAAEWRLIRRHPRIGHDMLAAVPDLQPALPLVRHHHEHWDGRGYPAGLKRRRIPLEARIFSVADALEAMTTDRPYRRARTVEEATVEIRHQSGKQFDPRVVRAFLDVPLAFWRQAAREVAEAAPQGPHTSAT